jgi:protein SCO1
MFSRPFGATTFYRATLILVAVHLSVQPSRAQHRHPEHEPAAVPSGREALAIPDVALVDQDGRPIHFYSDLVKGHVVAVNFVFTTCTTICPVMAVNFKKLRELTGDSVHLISVSVDPLVDTPARLRAWAAQFHVAAPWTLVTGAKLDVDRLLKALRVFTADKQDHQAVVLIGSGTGTGWIRASALAAPSKLAELVAAVRADVKDAK